MKRSGFLFLLLLPFLYSPAQTFQSDSLITDQVSFQIMLKQVQEINAKFVNRDSVTFYISDTLEWNYLCSYKTGWQETIGKKADGTGVTAFREDYNNIYLPRKSGEIYTYSQLTSKFNLTETNFIKDTSSNIISSPVCMLLNADFLLISFGSYYPNGNQTSWDYRHTYYFTRKFPLGMRQINN